MKNNKNNNFIPFIMLQIHHIWITIYCKPEDNEEDILENFRKFLPFNLEEEKIKIERHSAASVKERKIIIFQVHLGKTRHINKFIQHLNKILNQQQKELLLKQKESRLDEGNHFFVRFDKDKLIQENRFFITDKGNCYHLKMSIAAFPITRENALRVVEEIFA